jgi:hypothetical protein
VKASVLVDGGQACMEKIQMALQFDHCLY